MSSARADSEYSSAGGWWASAREAIGPSWHGLMQVSSATSSKVVVGGDCLTPRHPLQPPPQSLLGRAVGFQGLGLTLTEIYILS